MDQGADRSIIAVTSATTRRPDGRSPSVLDATVTVVCRVAILDQ